MNELTFDVKFLSDIVLPASSNTEGNIEQLDFIPGSNFLGMVAKEYAKFENAFAVFHSGAVRFGDARVVVEGKATYKMPLSFFHEKLDKTNMVNHHLIDDFTAFRQLKQKRKGYITADLQEYAVEHTYAQKSAYDREMRRSKESAMYGYQAIPRETLWQFSVRYDDTVSKEDIQRIKNNLIGTKRLGKSKSSQYGLIEIKASQKLQSVKNVFNENETVVYAKSRVALVDEDGMPTYDLHYLIEELKDENIVWEKCQIRTSTFTPYNGAMKTKTYERMVIQSGSVMVLKNLSIEQEEALIRGVGVYLAEGFGEVIVNPSFLAQKGKFTFKSNESKVKTSEALSITDPMVQFLEMREVNKRESLSLALAVNQFMEQNDKLYKNVSNAQWGTIRSICSSSSERFKEEIKTYLSSGVVSWNNQQIDAVLQASHSRKFIKLLSMEMPKVKNKGGK